MLRHLRRLGDFFVSLRSAISKPTETHYHRCRDEFMSLQSQNSIGATHQTDSSPIFQRQNPEQNQTDIL